MIKSHGWLCCGMCPEIFSTKEQYDDHLDTCHTEQPHWLEDLRSSHSRAVACISKNQDLQMQLESAEKSFQDAEERLGQIDERLKTLAKVRKLSAGLTDYHRTGNVLDKESTEFARRHAEERTRLDEVKHQATENINTIHEELSSSVEAVASSERLLKDLKQIVGV